MRIGIRVAVRLPLRTIVIEKALGGGSATKQE
jgi:hypothetical protein